MPYTITQTRDCPPSKPHAVVNQDTGKPVPGGCHETKEEAQKHLAALKANVPDAK